MHLSALQWIICGMFLLRHCEKVLADSLPWRRIENIHPFFYGANPLGSRERCLWTLNYYLTYSGVYNERLIWITVNTWWLKLEQSCFWVHVPGLKMHRAPSLLAPEWKGVRTGAVARRAGMAPLTVSVPTSSPTRIWRYLLLLFSQKRSWGRNARRAPNCSTVWKN